MIYGMLSRESAVYSYIGKLPASERLVAESIYDHLKNIELMHAILPRRLILVSLVLSVSVAVLDYFSNVQYFVAPGMVLVSGGILFFLYRTRHATKCEEQFFVVQEMVRSDIENEKIVQKLKELDFRLFRNIRKYVDRIERHL